MKRAEQIRRTSRRSDCYRLLSTCFYPPERRQLLQDRTCLELADALNETHPEAGAASHAAVMQEALTDLSDTELRVDHAALFVGPFQLKAPPYGSIYLEPHNVLMGDTTLAAAARYAEAGLELTLHEPPDHIAVELEFMHYLTTLGAQAAYRGDARQAGRLGDRARHFLNHHLGAWAPAFCDALRRGAETPYYRALAEALQTFIEADARESRAGRTQVPTHARPGLAGARG